MSGISDPALSMIDPDSCRRIVVDSSSYMSSGFDRLMHEISRIDRSLRVFYGIETLGHDGIRITQSLMLLQLVLDHRKPRFLRSPKHPTEGDI